MHTGARPSKNKQPLGSVTESKKTALRASHWHAFDGNRHHSRSARRHLAALLVQPTRTPAQPGAHRVGGHRRAAHAATRPRTAARRGRARLYRTRTLGAAGGYRVA